MFTVTRLRICFTVTVSFNFAYRLPLPWLLYLPLAVGIVCLPLTAHHFTYRLPVVQGDKCWDQINPPGQSLSPRNLATKARIRQHLLPRLG